MKQWEIKARSNKKEGEFIRWIIAAEDEDAAVDKGFELAQNHPDAEKGAIFCDQCALDTEGKEDKEEITSRLFEALHMTREFMNLESLTYRKDQEKVMARFEDGSKKKINVASDSGIALISDVIKNLR
jgi:hypothetical protein